MKANKGQRTGPWMEWDEDVEHEQNRALGASRPLQWYDEEFWLDYIEGETHQALSSDLTTLLRNSPRDRTIVDDLKATRDVVAASLEEPVLPESGEYYTQLADQIMGSIDKLEEDQTKASQTGRKLWRGGLASTSVVVGILALVSLLIGQTERSMLGSIDSVVLNQAQRLAAHSPEVLVASSTTITSQDRQELVSEALALRMAMLGSEQSAQLLGRLTH